LRSAPILAGSRAGPGGKRGRREEQRDGEADAGCRAGKIRRATRYENAMSVAHGIAQPGEEEQRPIEEVGDAPRHRRYPARRCTLRKLASSRERSGLILMKATTARGDKAIAERIGASSARRSSRSDTTGRTPQ